MRWSFSTRARRWRRPRGSGSPSPVPIRSTSTASPSIRRSPPRRCCAWRAWPAPCFYTPAAMIAAAILGAADPVVTAEPDRLRFESFSACCGVHARFDLHPDGLDVRACRPGTTNVDFNPPMREALGALAPQRAAADHGRRRSRRGADARRLGGRASRAAAGSLGQGLRGGAGRHQPRAGAVRARPGRRATVPAGAPTRPRTSTWAVPSWVAPCGWERSPGRGGAFIASPVESAGARAARAPRALADRVRHTRRGRAVDGRVGARPSGARA